jgi:predicted Fe-Mo cluster-binding NifX family protein
MLIPMDGDDQEESKITDVFSAESWALIEMDNGEVKNISFIESYNEIIGNIDTVIVKSEYEPIMEFLENEIMILVAPTQRTIEDIIEAYVFKELRDLS